MNSKQRSYLKGLAQKIEPLVIIGKNGINENVIKQIDDVLEARELIKIKVLNNAEFKASDVGIVLAESSRSDLVQTVGSMVILYRISRRKDIDHIDISNVK